MPASTDIAAILGVMDQSMRERQRVAENTEERAFRIGMTQWQEMANAQLQQQEIEQRTAMDIYKGYEAAKLQREKELSDLGDLTDVLAKDVKDVSPGLDRLMTDAASRISGEFQTLSGMQAKHMEVMDKIQQRTNVLATRIGAMNQAVGTYNAGKTDLPTIDYILQKSAGQPQGVEGTAGWIEQRRVSAEEFKSAIDELKGSLPADDPKRAALSNPAYIKGLQVAIGGVEDTRIEQELKLRDIMSKEDYYAMLKSGQDLEEWHQTAGAMHNLYEMAQPKPMMQRVQTGWDAEGRPIYEQQDVLVGGNRAAATQYEAAIKSLLGERFPGLSAPETTVPQTKTTGALPWNVELNRQIKAFASAGIPQYVERARKLGIPTDQEIEELLRARDLGLSANAPDSARQKGYEATKRLIELQTMGLIEE